MRVRLTSLGSCSGSSSDPQDQHGASRRDQDEPRSQPSDEDMTFESPMDADVRHSLDPFDTYEDGHYLPQVGSDTLEAKINLQGPTVGRIRLRA